MNPSEEKAKNDNIIEDNIKEGINDDLPQKTKENIQLAYSLKEQGDSELKENKGDAALKSYTKAVLAVKFLIKEKLINEDIAMELKNKVLIPSNLNMSYIDLKRKDYTQVIRHCTKVLFVDKTNVKALYRRCTAYIYSGNFKKADADLFELEDLIGGTNELEDLEKLYEDNKKKADGNSGEFLKKMGKNLKGNKGVYTNTQDGKTQNDGKYKKKIGALNKLFSRIANGCCCFCKKRNEYFSFNQNFE